MTPDDQVKQRIAELCVWTYDDGHEYQTECGEHFNFECGEKGDNVRFCPNCGKKIRCQDGQPLPSELPSDGGFDGGEM